MKKLVDYLQEAKTCYLATIDNNKPQIRPIGGKPILSENGFIELDGKIYFYTDNRKPMFRQMNENPAIAITFIVADGFIRLTGEAAFNRNMEAKRILLSENKSLSQLYKFDDVFFEVYYLRGIEAYLYAKGQEPIRLD